jgi:hypothetical protein
MQEQMQGHCQLHALLHLRGVRGEDKVHSLLAQGCIDLLRVFAQLADQALQRLVGGPRGLLYLQAQGRQGRGSRQGSGGGAAGRWGNLLFCRWVEIRPLHVAG